MQAKIDEPSQEAEMVDNDVPLDNAGADADQAQAEDQGYGDGDVDMDDAGYDDD